LTHDDCFRFIIIIKNHYLAVLSQLSWSLYDFPIKVCAICSEEFELKPDKPGFANRCPECSAPDSLIPVTKRPWTKDQLKGEREANEARRQAIRDLFTGRMAEAFRIRLS